MTSFDKEIALLSTHQGMLILKTAVEQSVQRATTVIGGNTDLLVLLLYYARDVKKRLYFRPDKSLSSAPVVAARRALSLSVFSLFLFGYR